MVNKLYYLRNYQIKKLLLSAVLVFLATLSSVFGERIETEKITISNDFVVVSNATFNGNTTFNKDVTIYGTIIQSNLSIIIDFSGVDFVGLVGTNNPDDTYQFSLTVATNPAFTGTTVSFQSTNNPSSWFYWNGSQFEDMETGDIPHLYINSYQARVVYIWTNAVRGVTYYCRGYIINSDLWYVENIINKILEMK